MAEQPTGTGMTEGIRAKQRNGFVVEQKPHSKAGLDNERCIWTNGCLI
ncbi:MAG: hypothetical protein P8O03_13205 [Ilumatobacter sp.]|nr:hypothetical protein [Ilumatobacter sp.]